MAMISTNEFKAGLKLMLDGDPCSIVENEFVKPGKGQAFNRVKLRNLKTGRILERTFKSGETLEAADVVDTDVEPNFVNLAVTETDPGLRGDTASGATKPATMETGAVIKVPLFIEEGEVLKIDTRTGAYVSRVKE